MSLTFEGNPLHRYTLDGVVVPSVTTILKWSGLINFDGIPAATLKAAQERGTTVHEAIALLNEGDLDAGLFQEDFPGYWPYVEAWIKFTTERSFVPVLTEHRVASRRYQVAGTLDSLGTLDGQAVLLDYATGRAEDVCKRLQTSAYEILAREWAADDPALKAFFDEHPFIKRYAVELRRDGTFNVHGYNAQGEGREFLALVTAQQIVAKYRGERMEVAA